MKWPSISLLALALALAGAGCRRAETVTPEGTKAVAADATPSIEADLRMVTEVEQALVAQKLRRDEARRELGRALAEGRPFVTTPTLLSEEALAKQLGHDPVSYRRAQLRIREAVVELQIREERADGQRFRAVELDILRKRAAEASDPAERADLTALIAEIEAIAARDAEPPTPERARELAAVAAHLARAK